MLLNIRLIRCRVTLSKITFIIFICCLLTWKGSAQTQFPTSDSILVFWQPENHIGYEDYRYPSPVNDIYAEIALWTVLDLPQNAEVLRPHQMKIYIAPVCNRYMSRANKNDSSQIAIDNIYFDILELSAREARLKLSNLPDSAMKVKDLSETFKAIVREMHENRLRMNRKFIRELREKKVGTLQSWQQKLNQDLGRREKWATQPAECYRFLQNHPIEAGYSEDLNSNAVLLNKTEQVLGRDTWHAEFCQMSRFRK